MSDLRSKVIRLAHQNPELRPHLLPLLQDGRTAADHLAALVQPKGYGDPMYEGNAMAVPLTWGVTKTMDPHDVSKFIEPLFEKANNGVAYVLDQNGVFAAAGLSAVEKALQERIHSDYYEQAGMDEEWYQDHPDAEKARQALARSWKKVDAAKKMRVKITPITSPKSGKAGLKVVFSPTVEQIAAIR